MVDSQVRISEITPPLPLQLFHGGVSTPFTIKFYLRAMYAGELLILVSKSGVS